MRDALGDVQSLVVLGGGSDIALAITTELVSRRTRRVTLAARHPDALATNADELRASGADVQVVTYDATVDGATASVLDTAGAAGDIDVVLIAFGWLDSDYSLDASADDVRRSIDINLTAAAVAAHETAQHLRRQGHGTIAVLSSVAGQRVRKGIAPYGAAKAGLDGFILALDDALAGSGVSAMVIRPGHVHTKMTEGRPVTPFATGPEVVAERTVKGLARQRRVVWSPGPLRFVFGALRLLPEPIWRRLNDR
jgi:decaprenylphospho-beta-D-erythro-pentofuranosid-2-ulose 2-reductase